MIVSSTESTRHAASDAAVMELIFTTAGSHTHASKLSEMSSVVMFTPNQVPPTHTRARITTNVNQLWTSGIVPSILYTVILIPTLGVFLAQLVENIGAIKAGIFAQLLRNDFKRASKGPNEQLFLAGDGARVFTQVLAQLHLNGSTTCCCTSQLFPVDALTTPVIRNEPYMVKSQNIVLN